MRDLHALTATNEHGRVLSYQVAATNRGKSNRLVPALARDTLAPEDRALPQVPAQCTRYDLAHAQGGAGRRIHLVTVMRLDDFDIVALAEGLRRNLQQPESDVNTHTEVRRKRDCNLARGLGDLLLLRIAEASGPDDQPHFLLAARCNMRHRAFGPGEVDQHVASGKGLGDIVRDLHAARGARQLARILTDMGIALDLERRRKFQLRIAQDRVDQRSPHASGGAGNSKLQFRHDPVSAPQ